MAQRSEEEIARDISQRGRRRVEAGEVSLWDKPTKKKQHNKEQHGTSQHEQD